LAGLFFDFFDHIGNRKKDRCLRRRWTSSACCQPASVRVIFRFKQVEGNMDIPMSPDEVTKRIKHLKQQGVSLSKKKVKQMDPELMQSALYYYPSWDHAVTSSLNIKQ
jgi:hypothetical protein